MGKLKKQIIQLQEENTRLNELLHFYLSTMGGKAIRIEIATNSKGNLIIFSSGSKDHDIEMTQAVIEILSSRMMVGQELYSRNYMTKVLFNQGDV